MSINNETDRLAAYRLRGMREALTTQQIGVELVTSAGDIVTEGLPPDWMSTLLTPAQRSHLAFLREAVAEGSREASMRIEAAAETGGQVLQITCTGASGDGSITTIVADVSEDAAHERVLAGLLREVSHRSKNLLAIVLSIASQTARHSADTEAFLAKFRGRILALSSAQDLITASDWVGTPFTTLVADQVLRAGMLPQEAIAVRGDDPMLGPNAALHVGLALHELIVNAATHCSLDPGAERDICIDVHADGTAGGSLVIEWLEQRCDDQPISPPEFGTLLLETIVPRSLSGAAHYAVDRQTVSYRLEVPAAQLSG